MSVPTNEVLARLAAMIADRRRETAETSYTKSLLSAGPAKCAKKFGEEAVEFALAMVAEDDAAVIGEAADVLYHMLVALEAREVALADVLAKLEARMGISGHVEKAGRSS